MQYYKILIKKLFRTIWATRRQFIALVFCVAIGSSMLLGPNTAYKSLELSLDEFFENTNMPDYYYEFEPTDARTLKNVAYIKGVEQAEVRLGFSLSVKTNDYEKISAMLYTFEESSEQGFMRCTPWGATEILDEEVKEVHLPLLIDFISAQKYHYNIGDKVKLISKGKEIIGVIKGYCTSPEYIGLNSIKFVAHRNTVCENLGLKNVANQLFLNFSNDMEQDETLNRLERYLRHTHILKKFGEDEHPAKEFTRRLMTSLKIGTYFAPVVFFGVAILFLYVLLKQIIKNQHVQIGIMKALGFSNDHIMLFYVLYAVFLSIVGNVIGLFGGFVVAHITVRGFGESFYLRNYIVNTNYTIFIICFIISHICAVLSAIAASWRIIQINPVDAMRRLPIIKGQNLLLEKLNGFWLHINEKWRMTLRVISRNRVRFIITTLVITACVSIIILALGFDNSRAELIERTYEKEYLYDYQLDFEQGVPAHVWAEWVDRYGADSIEPYLHFDAIIKNKFSGKSDKNTLAMLYNDSEIQAVYNKKNRRLSVDKGEIILSHQVAKRIDADIGDDILIISKGREKQFRVVDIAYQLITMKSYLSPEDISAFFEGGTVTRTLFIKAEDRIIDNLKKNLSSNNNILNIQNKKEQKQHTADMLQNMKIFAYGFIILATCLGAGIIYNACTINFEERQRELSILKVIGLKNIDISMMLYFELVLQMAVGFILGIPLGKIGGVLSVRQISTEYYVYPDKIYLKTYLIAALVTITFVTVSHMLAMFRLRHLIMTEVLKERE